MKEMKKTKAQRARIAALMLAALFLLTAFGGCGKRKDGAETVPEAALEDTKIGKWSVGMFQIDSGDGPTAP